MIHQMRWTAKKIAQRLGLVEPLVHRQKRPLDPFRYKPLAGPETEPPLEADLDDRGWEVIEPNTYWGTWQTTFVMRSSFDVPGDWPADASVALYLPLGEPGDFSHPEALAYIDGTAYAACDRHHQEILLPERWRDGRSHRLLLHGWTGLDGWFKGEPDTKLFMRPCAVVQIDQPTRDFVATARIALGVADQLDDNEPAKGLLYNALDDAFKQLDLREPFDDRFYDSVPAAHASLQAGIEKAGPPLNVSVVASGHAHIDVAWLWSLAQTRLKAGRTFHTVLRLMEQFPDYIFTQSQPQLYEYVRQDYPELLEAIKARVAEGRWEPIGGMWVEADCNLSGGEALARQFLLGRAYFRELFGPDAESPVMWLPDVFGYAWNLPQLIREAGLEYFFTIKISWNQYNRMPYDSFWWQGLDGTKVLTHFSTTQDEWSLKIEETRRPTTYNAVITPLEVMSTWQNLQQKETQQELLIAFGYGDGGGGPTREMLENIREMTAFPATPRTKNGRAIDFFRRLEETAGERLPTWNGELYLEYHRGTYTTQAKNKKGNRQSEFLLHDAEFLAAWAALATEYTYPHDALTQAWRLLCLNQFHDILPGSSIAEVYEDSDRDYAAIRKIGEAIREEALIALAGRMPAKTDILVANPTSFGGRQIALLPEKLPAEEGVLTLKSDQPLLSQPVEGGTLVEIPHIDPYGLLALQIDRTAVQPITETLKIDREDRGFKLENRWLQVIFDDLGDLTQLFDKEAGRNVLPDGEIGNRFQAFEDRPLNWDAWDIDIFYDDKEWTAEPAHSLTIIEAGPLRVGLEIRRRLLSSQIVQRVYLHRDGRRLDFDTWVDWQERHVLLKVAFPVNVLSPMATFDVQWGNVERPTHRNTSWDWARFETCAHKWVDCSEGNYGVSLLNDCKYGHDIQDNVMRLTLLRSPTHPDPDADRGEHRFTYSVMPHAGDWRGGTVAAAYALNDPLIARRINGRGVNGPPTHSLVSVDAPNVIIETVKQAEDGRGLIVRLYENERCRGPVTLRTGFPVAQALRCNLLEEDQETIEFTTNEVYFSIKPYQIITLRLVRK
ncbi:MAG: alpha-mannosidase [Ardenticatenaceae bacterium]|nr:alpha-mannosidase [Ardenticatenaceae bacterium]